MLNCRLLSGRETPELPDLGTGPGRFCSTGGEPEEQLTWGSAQPCYCCRRLLRRDAGCLVPDEIPSHSSWVRNDSIVLKPGGCPAFTPEDANACSVFCLPNVYNNQQMFTNQQDESDAQQTYPSGTCVFVAPYASF